MEKQYDHQTHEQKIQALWKEEQTYRYQNNSKLIYSVDTPPPTVSGNLHIGHIFSYTQTDIIARYKRMSGFSVFYPFGFDDNGLPTERYVEKKRGINAHTLSRSEFIVQCLEETVIVEEQFKSLWQKIGLSADWRLTYSTISPQTRKISQESFIRLYEKGYVYRADEPALYCTTCRTSVAQAELDDTQKPSFFNDIVFKDANNNNLIISTTRPELLPSCVALFYNPNDARYQHLKDTFATVPLFGHTVPIFADEQVEIEKGTGLVMCCTFGDKTDIAWFKKFKLPYRQTIGADGRFTAQTPLLAGLKVIPAREKVIEELKKEELILNQRPISHAVNIHERCKKEIEYIMIQQWFLSILKHKQTFIDLADTIEWHPKHMKMRYKNWVENIGWDWCLSRQRFYGIPFPAWHCVDCNTILLAPIKDLPIDPQEQPYPGDTCTSCSSSNIVPDTDVMDTWNTSSLTPYICAALYNQDAQSAFEENQSFLPMSMRPQAHDIIRTWAFYTIVKSWMHNKKIPWDTIVISGHVLSNEKEKLSKSKNNSAHTPEALLARYSADVIRYWTASGTLGTDIAFSETQLKIGQRLVTKLWNAFRFIHMHLEHYTPEKPTESLGEINEWLLHTVTARFTVYENYFKTYEFNLALDQAEQFFWNDFCDNYLELIKDLLFNPDNYSKNDVINTRWTLYQVGLRILQLYAPYLPYITEALYGTLYKQHEQVSSIHLTEFATVQTKHLYADSFDVTQFIIALVGTVRKLKTEQQLSLKTPLAHLTIYAPTKKLLERLGQHEQLIKGISKAEAITWEQNAQELSVLETKNDAWYATISTTGAA